MVDTAPPDVVFEGNSRDAIRGFPDEVRRNLGSDLQRVQEGDLPLDSGSMAPALPGVFELRDEDRDTWYRAFYVKLDGVVHVLHCFTKKTNETPKGDIEIGRKRLSDLKEKLTKQKKQSKKQLTVTKHGPRTDTGATKLSSKLFEDLGFSPEEAAALKLKTDLHTKIVKCAARYSQGQLQVILDESQPRVSDLLRGKMSKFSLETLVIYAEKLGIHPEIRTRQSRAVAAD